MPTATHTPSTALPATPRQAPRLARRIAAWAVAGSAALLAGCADMGYYWQSVSGHVQLMRAAQPIDDWLADPKAPEALKTRLALARRMRAFAVDTLGLPDNPSYHRYADLHRQAAVWNVVAAPPLSLTLKTWCFPVTGCVGYRGYYSETDAQAEAQALHSQQGLEVMVYGVPAYSTLGWMNWAGGDPLLNTFIGYPEGELARLIFHELAHQVVYAEGDTTFNESFATAVERIGIGLWLATEAGAPAREEYAAFDQRRNEFRALTLATRKHLAAIYAGQAPEAPASPSLLADKEAAMRDFRSAYAALRDRWGPQARVAGYDAWVARANNASFGAQAAYDELVPGFEALFARIRSEQAGTSPWPAFYAAVKALARQPKAERQAALHRLAEAPAPSPAAR